MPDLAQGTVIAGRYTVSGRLGSGGMADVYLAQDSELGRQVAIKVLHRRFADDPSFVGRFRQEAEAAAGLQHPNVVSVFDRGEWDGTSYIAMEYLPGVTLKELIRTQGPFDAERAVRIGGQIAQAVGFAHRAGIVHRDIKPQNVMVGPDDRVTVTDFGIARAGSAGVTEAGSIMGTAHYISPEQAQGQDAGPQADVYAVGVVLYEMLTGQVPFDAESPVAIALKQVSQEPAAPSSVVPSVPADLDALVLWCLRKSPADRPATTDDLVRGLDAVGERLRADADAGTTVAFGAPPPVVSLETARTGTAAAVGAAAGAAAASEPEDPAAEDDATDAKPDNTKRNWWIAGGVLAAAAIALTIFFVTKPATVTMPLVVGKDLQTATTIVANAGLTQAPSVQRVQSTQPRDQVIRQNPLANDKVDSDSKVTLTVSDGPGKVQIPTVADLPAADAERELKSVGFKVLVREKGSNDTDKGNAIGTDPAAGLSVLSGSQVTLFVSSGPDKVVLVDVTGRQIADARQTLQDAGFVVVTTSAVSTEAPGTVIAENPPGGTKADRGSTVTLTVAKAAPIPDVAVPDVTGKTQSAATSALTSAGFKVVASGSGTQVLSTDPAAGTKAPKGTTVTINLGTPTTTTTSTTPSTP